MSVSCQLNGLSVNRAENCASYSTSKLGKANQTSNWTAVNIPLMRTLLLRTGSLHACSIRKKTRQTEPAQQNNESLTLGGRDINNTVLLWWLSSLPSSEMKVDTIKLLQRWVVKKKETNKNRKTTNNNNAFWEGILCHTWKGEIAHEMALLYSAVVKSISLTNLNDFKVCHSQRDRVGKMEDQRDRRGIKGRSSPIALYP